MQGKVMVNVKVRVKVQANANVNAKVKQVTLPWGFGVLKLLTVLPLEKT